MFHQSLIIMKAMRKFAEVNGRVQKGTRMLAVKHGIAREGHSDEQTD